MNDRCASSRMEVARLPGIGYTSSNGNKDIRVLSSNATNSTEQWYTVEQFEKEHVIEILEKLEYGDLDDEIWGKIILMEKCKCLAKAYLRKTTVIIDGSSDEYDGITLGFNYFQNNDYNKDKNNIRHKIGDGVIIKIDRNGNIKAMARDLAPVIVQGWHDPVSKCIPDQLISQEGHLKTIKDRLKGITDQQRVEKIFDMRLFNLAMEHELKQLEPNIPELLLKTCTRIALVKDAGKNALKTPCWFMIINLVALDVLRSKLPILNFIPKKQYDHSQITTEIFPSYTKQSLSYTNSNDILTTIKEGKHNKDEWFQLKDLSMSSSGFNSMNLVKNPEKVENWSKNSLKFLNEHEEEFLNGEEMDNITSLKHKLMKSMDDKQWSMKAVIPKEICSSSIQRNTLMLNSNLSLNKSDDELDNLSSSDAYQNAQCTKIYDHEYNRNWKMNQATEKYFQIANSKLEAQQSYTKSIEQTNTPSEIMEIASYPTYQLDSQRTSSRFI
ncbi:MH2 domain family protein [Brugia pahangi]